MTKNGEENWDQSARQVHLLLLWQDQMKNQDISIWHRGSCRKTVVGGAWTYNTISAVTVQSATRRLKELKEQ
ncbi:hypothetical protein U0070_014172 [Myodes glareolus]|uniref:Uncharacterized protein n=1 Tax=Myodes glareolus TaxID=447135 RepID=A0AAW0INE9_MYOGA